MKNILAILFIISSSIAYAEQKLTPLDMELGYWETTTTINASEAITQMLASIPEAQREMVRQTMASSANIPVHKECVTKESLSNLKDRFTETLNDITQDCKLTITKSTRTEFMGVLNCASNNKTTIQTKVINSKHHESKIISAMAQMGETSMTTTGKWKSATCPKGIK